MMQGNINNEQRILAYYFTNVSKWNELEDLEDYFLIVQSKNVCKGLLYLLSKNITVFSLDTLYNATVNQGIEVDMTVLIHIQTTFTEFFNISEAIETLKSDKIRHNLSNTLVEDLYVNINERNPQYLEKIEQTANTILDEVNKLKQDIDILLHTDLLVNKYWEKSKERKDQKFRTTIGYEELDKLLTTPCQAREMTALVGQKGSGKSTFATNIASRLLTMDIPILLILLEEDYQKILDRIISMRTQIPFLNLRRGKYEEIEEIKMHEVTDMIKVSPKFFVADHSSLDIKGVRRLIKQVQKLINQEYMVVIIDVTSMLKDFSNCKTPKEITSKVDMMHSLAKETGVHIINILQENENRWRNNTVKLKNLKYFKPSMADIKDASSYAERCRIVIYLWNEQYIKKVFIGEEEEEEEIGPPIIEARIIKQNDGEVGVGVDFLFDVEHCRMTVHYAKEEPKERDIE